MTGKLHASTVNAYGNQRGNAGVEAYEYGSDWIRIRFARSNDVYEYTARAIGRANLATMKRLAEAGAGLTTFINQNPAVKDNFSIVRK
ncbi:MAG TPA: hypothetical protein VHF69_05740 [Candidatus Synoicihabitans sp.]|nr:hypothetical protein [Candidatus Synoicihabitans sp.]